MVFNYKIRSDLKKAREFLLANKYDAIINRRTGDIAKYIHKNSNRILFTMSLLPHLKPEAKILEIGAMPFCFSTLLMEAFSCEVATIDLPQAIFPGEPYSIEEEEIEIPNSISHKNYKISSWVCNAEKDVYPFKDGTFDLVICTEVLEHLLYSPSHVLKESRRVLKEGGLMLVSTVNSLHFKRMADIILNYNIDDVHSPLGIYCRHNRNCTRKELLQLAEDTGFKVRFFTSATIKGCRYEEAGIPDAEIRKIEKKRNKFLEKAKKIPRKMFLNFVKCIVSLPLPGMKDKRHVNIFLLLQK